ncbi:hypothetical protein MGYG_03053 [Nannizzia gypsea CBS 118893]|uniref:Uncharacterized protein n=1 Tax=Arthroderma gypseum (strain ATCC MYA-4604 / CBS 118893) TaxID=535722 RepID=E4UQH7_ARTGP|nr:hypothetical protein MGYG_03053 [Nannizzia gypsea CBS 118893]EFR00047.1 hypothetical protein MGYG_03053 [Nannizzia gypsea CBS 118893]
MFRHSRFLNSRGRPEIVIIPGEFAVTISPLASLAVEETTNRARFRNDTGGQRPATLARCAVYGDSHAGFTSNAIIKCTFRGFSSRKRNLEKATTRSQSSEISAV